MNVGHGTVTVTFHVFRDSWLVVCMLLRLLDHNLILLRTNVIALTHASGPSDNTTHTFRTNQLISVTRIHIVQ